MSGSVSSVSESMICVSGLVTYVTGPVTCIPVSVTHVPGSVTYVSGSATRISGSVTHISESVTGGVLSRWFIELWYICTVDRCTGSIQVRVCRFYQLSGLRSGRGHVAAEGWYFQLCVIASNLVLSTEDTSTRIPAYHVGC